MQVGKLEKQSWGAVAGPSIWLEGTKSQQLPKDKHGAGMMKTSYWNKKTESANHKIIMIFVLFYYSGILKYYFRERGGRLKGKCLRNENKWDRFSLFTVFVFFRDLSNCLTPDFMPILKLKDPLRPLLGNTTLKTNPWFR